ncbi:tetratricopeptide repeat protein [Nonomuraea sp. NPDC003709]|uniref:tetratricopeptide repeat protein n=1 Tax=Nonomuraea sp. NPDC003709 TaxID=3154450 RepID=UPI0033A3333E
MGNGSASARAVTPIPRKRKRQAEPWPLPITTAGGGRRAAGELSRAIPLYEATLANSERVLGSDHPNTLISRNNLAGAIGRLVI